MVSVMMISTEPSHRVHQVVVSEEMSDLRAEWRESEHECEGEPAEEEGEDDGAHHESDSPLARLLQLHLPPSSPDQVQVPTVPSILLHLPPSGIFV